MSLLVPQQQREEVSVSITPDRNQKLVPVLSGKIEVLKLFRDFRRIDERPGANVLRRVNISVVVVATAHAQEFGLGWSIPLIGTAAGRALATGVPGIYQNYRYSVCCCLVLDKHSQLMERPAMYPVSLRLV